MINVNDVKVTGGELEREEIEAYIKYAEEKYSNRRIVGMDINVDGEEVDLKFYFDSLPFDRIRRITGYLVGTLDRFNDAKRSEEHDRVKHNT